MNLFPENISTYGQDLDDLFYLICAISGFAFIVTLIVMIYPLIKYRYNKNRKSEYIKGTGKELKWVWVALVLLALGDFYILVVEHPTWVEIEETLPEEDNAFKVAISGSQWYWDITYPGRDGILYTSDDIYKMNELCVPVNNNVLMDLKATDVVHSIFFPNIRLKQDVLPGRTISRWFKPIKEGEYDIACAEICGIAHSIMKGTLIVESEDENNIRMEKYILIEEGKKVGAKLKIEMPIIQMNEIIDSINTDFDIAIPDTVNDVLIEN